MSLNIIIVGSGPSAFYTAQALLKSEIDCKIDFLEKLPFPYGLIRYGVAPDHQKTKNVIRIFERIANNDKVRYFGNVEVGKDIDLNELRKIYDAVVIATGCGIDKKLNIEGTNKEGFYGSTEFVGWYNGHPDFCNLIPDLSSDTAVVIGNGNVAIDCARVLLKNEREMYNSDIMDYARNAISNSNIKKVYIIGRRGPFEAKFTIAELREMGELENCKPILDEYLANSDTYSFLFKKDTNLDEYSKNIKILNSFHHQLNNTKTKSACFNFFSKPVKINGKKKIESIKFIRTNIVDGKLLDTKYYYDIKCGIVISAIGYQGESIKGISFDTQSGIIPNNEGVIDSDLYTAGWISRGPSGVIGTNKRDGDVVAKHIISKSSSKNFDSRSKLIDILANRKINFITFEDWEKIDEIEKLNAQSGAPRLKFTKYDKSIIKKIT